MLKHTDAASATSGFRLPASCSRCRWRPRGHAAALWALPAGAGRLSQADLRHGPTHPLHRRPHGRPQAGRPPAQRPRRRPRARWASPACAGLLPAAAAEPRQRAAAAGPALPSIRPRRRMAGSWGTPAHPTGQRVSPGQCVRWRGGQRRAAALPACCMRSGCAAAARHARCQGRARCRSGRSC